MPRHSDFEEIYQAMQEQYCTGKTDETSPKGGPCEKGEQVYNAWLNKHGYDDEKSLNSQKSQTRHIEFDKLFRELFRRLRAAALWFYENWLQEHNLNDTIAMSLQKFQAEDRGLLYFMKEEKLHLRTNMMLSGSFEKIDGVDDDFVVAGYASTCIEDTWGDKFTPDMIRDGAEKYFETPIVFYCHRRSEPAGLVLREYETADGKILKTAIDEVGWFVVSRPSNALRNVKELIKEGLLKAYSIGGYYIFDKLGSLVGTTIHDVSYVPRPANKLSYHGIVSRSDIGIHRREEKLEKEEVQTLLDEKGKEIVEEINSALDEFKEGLKTEITDLVAKRLEGYRDSEALKAEIIELLDEKLGGFSEAGITAKLEAIDGVLKGLKGEGEAGHFTKADFDALVTRVAEVEDMPFIKGMGPQLPGGDDVHEKLWSSDDPLAEVERMRRGK